MVCKEIGTKYGLQKLNGTLLKVLACTQSGVDSPENKGVKNIFSNQTPNELYGAFFLVCGLMISLLVREAVAAVPGVHVGCGLIDDQDTVLPQDGSGQTHQLSLSHAEVGARLGQNRLQLTRQLLHH